MKKKFESNVASEMPKTKIKEPNLPWKLDAEDVEKIGRQDGDYRSIAAGTPPLKTRAIFLILLVLAIFTASFYLISNAMIENDNVRMDVLKRERDLMTMQANIEKLKMEKSMADKNSTQLEKKLNDMNAQKELFTSVIENLTKKTDDAETANKEGSR